MNAKYLGRRKVKNDFGEVTSTYSPCVLVTMRESELSKFHKMMDWIEHQYVNYDYDVFQDDDIVSVYVEVSDGADGADFLESYKEAKRAVH